MRQAVLISGGTSGIGLAAVHSLLAGELIWKPSQRKKLVVKMNKSH